MDLESRVSERQVYLLGLGKKVRRLSIALDVFGKNYVVISNASSVREVSFLLILVF
jgi:hypothetical protein